MNSMSNKIHEGWIAACGNEIDHATEIFSSAAEVPSSRDSVAVKIIAKAGGKGEHGFVATIGDELTQTSFNHDLRSFDMARCAIGIAGWMLKNCANISQEETETLKKFYKWYKPYKLHQMTRLFEVFQKRGITIEPLDYVLPDGYHFSDKVIVNDGDWMENINNPAIEKKVKIVDGFYRVERDDSYHSAEALQRYWRKVDGGPAFRFIKFFIDKMKDRSENKRRGYIYDLSRIAIKSKMRFDPDDFKRIIEIIGDKYYRPQEWDYEMMIESGNLSAQIAYERWKDREAFWFAGEKLYVGKRILLRGNGMRVTSFSDDGNTVVVCHQIEEDAKYGTKIKTKSVVKLTREQLAAQSTEDVALNTALMAVRAKTASLGIHFESPYQNKTQQDVFMCWDCVIETDDRDSFDWLKKGQGIEEPIKFCKCGKAFYTDPSKETLAKEFDNFTFDANDKTSMVMMLKFFEIAYDNVERIVELCKPLVAWHQEEISKQSESEE